ncbi:MAG: DEAD/DEAH box helicase [Pseudomonadota bacterium]
MDFSKLESLFPSAFVERGRSYFADRRVLAFDATSDGSAISSRVAGTGDAVYECFIQVAQRDVQGRCTCPVGYNCKHVVATLLYAQAQRMGMPGDAAADTANLSFATRHWLQTLDASLSGEASSAQGGTQLFYLLDVSESHTGKRLTVQLVKAGTLANGAAGKPQRFTLSGGRPKAQFLDDQDHIALALIRGALPDFAPSEITLAGALGGHALAAMLETGRARWQQFEGPALHSGGPRRGALTWRVDDSARLGVEAVQEDESLVLLPVSPLWYVDTVSGTCGHFETTLAARTASVLASAPPVAADEVAPLRERLVTAAPDMPLPALPEIRDRHVTPTPRLVLDSVDLGAFSPQRWRGAGQAADWINVADLRFDYGGHEVGPGDDKAAVTIRQGNGFVRIPRDTEAEAEAAAALEELGLVIDVGVPGRDTTALTLDSDDAGTWLELVENELPRLREAGWEVRYGQNFQYQLVDADAWIGELQSSDRGWFDLELGVEVEGKRLNLLPIVAEVIQQAAENGTIDELIADDAAQGALARLEDGRVLRIPPQRLRPILSTLVELFSREPLGLDGRLRFADAQAGLLADLEAAGAPLQWRGGGELRRRAQRLRDVDSIARAPVPAGLNGELRGYQRDGLDWLQFLREYKLHGILADDMGLGKTIQVLAHLLSEKEAGRADRPSLVVAPTSLMLNWRREAQRFAPDLKVLTLHGPGRSRYFHALADYDLVLTTYPLLPRDKDVLLEQPYHVAVLDEAQFIKNPRTGAAQVACALQARHRLCLTGTPMENHLGELWSLFSYLMPGLLDSQQKFRRLFRTPIERHGDEQRRDVLRRRIAPFLLRREKDVVLQDLPPKTEILREVALEDSQRDLYETLRLAMHDRVRDEIAQRGFARSGIVVLDALLKLRQVCCDPRLVKLDAARRVKASAKMELLEDMLPALIEDGRRILLFSQFTGMLKLIEAYVRKAGIDYVQLTGSTRDRATPIDRFQAGEVPLFLISLKAGGAGLNLTAADTVIHYDPWWNPAVERQATDRAYRIGQDKPVFVYKLIATGTVEQIIAGMQAEKQELADAILGGGATAGTLLTPEVVDELFAPLD